MVKLVARLTDESGSVRPAAPGTVQLTERALALLMLGFVVAILVGSVVVVTQYLAVSTEPLTATVAVVGAG